MIEVDKAAIAYGVAVRCETPEKAAAFLEWAGSKNYRWCDRSVMGYEIRFFDWNRYKEKTCICLTRGAYGTAESFGGYTILDYDDILKKDQAPSASKPKAFNVRGGLKHEDVLQVQTARRIEKLNTCDFLDNCNCPGESKTPCPLLGADAMCKVTQYEGLTEKYALAARRWINETFPTSGPAPISIEPRSAESLIAELEKEIDDRKKRIEELKQFKPHLNWMPGFNGGVPLYAVFKKEKDLKNFERKQDILAALLNFQAENDPTAVGKKWNGQEKHWFIVGSATNRTWEVGWGKYAIDPIRVYFTSKKIADAALEMLFGEGLLNRERFKNEKDLEIRSQFL